MAILTALDGVILTAIENTDGKPESLQRDIACDHTTLQKRIDRLVDAGLVMQGEGDVYELTVSGRRIRALQRDSRNREDIDLPAPVVRMLDRFRLQPEQRAAIRAAFSFLTYWEEATTSEIVEAVYRAYPMGYTSPREWWTRCVREQLTLLPDVVPPNDVPLWRYTGDRDEDHVEDGRHVIGCYGSVRHALEHLPHSDREKQAVRAAFAYLYEHGRCSKQDLIDAIYPEFSAKYDSAADWWEQCIRDAFDAFPRVIAMSETKDEWQYSSVIQYRPTTKRRHDY